MCRLLMFFACLVFSGSAAVAQETTRQWRILEADLRCIEEHLETYLAESRDRLTIVLPACPEVDFQSALEKMATASGLARTPDTETRRFVTVTPQELLCLIAQLPGQDGFVLVNPEAICG